MKINSELNVGHPAGSVTRKKTEKKISDSVVFSEIKSDNFISDVNKLKNMQSCRKNTEEKKILASLMKAENKPEDAKTDLEFIKEHKHKNRTLKDSSDEFLEILTTLGNENTEEVREVFKRISTIECNKEREEEKEVLLNLAKAENELKQGIENFDIVKQYKNEKYTLKAGADEFSELLTTLGKDNTEEARAIYKRYSPIKDDRERSEVKEVIMKLGKAENEFKQGIENFDFINGYKHEDKTLKRAAKEFSELLTTLGNDNTEEAREIFKRIGSMKDGKEKQEAKEVIMKLGKAENEFKQGIENFDFIKGYKHEDKTLKEAAHEFSELLTTLGNDNTEEAREIFKRIGSMKDGKEKQEAKEVIMKLGKAENEFKQGIENFDFIKGYKHEDKTLKRAAKEFSELLTILGNDNTEEAREIFKRIGSMKDGKEKEEAKEVIMKLGKAENEFKQGIENFDFIKGYKHKDKTLREAAGEFLKILSKAGNDNTDEARKKFIALNR